MSYNLQKAGYQQRDDVSFILNFRLLEEEKKNNERRCELLERENSKSRKDISRITNELVLKVNLIYMKYY